MGALQDSEAVLLEVNRSSVLLSDLDESLGSDCWADEEDSGGDGEMGEMGEVADVMASVRVLLQGLGEDLSRDGLVKTPLRVARALLSATRGHRLSAERIIGGALFAEASPENGQGGGSGGMVVVRSIDLFATCESCLLPFRVCCHIAYIPSGQRVVGLSKLPRVAEVFATRLQSPERLVNEIAQALADSFMPLGVAVVAECWHLQWPGGCNGVNQQHSHPVESASWVARSVCTGRGKFEDRSCEQWSEFLALLQLAGIDVQPSSKKGVLCPFHSLGENGKSMFTNGMDCNGFAAGLPMVSRISNGVKPSESASKANIDAMVEAVRSLLRALGEDPDREELNSTPLRFVRWLLASTQGSRGPHVVDLNSTICKLNGSLTEDSENVVRAVIDLPFCSQCEHHLLPFSGVAHISYIPAAAADIKHIDRLVFQKVLKLYSCRLQVQERLTRQVAQAVMSSCGVSGVMVVLEASHVCMISRGVKKVGSTTATLATLGQFACDARARADFLHRISRRGKLA